MYDELVNKYGYVDAQVGQNEDGENVIVSIDDNEASIRTIQHNGWHRINVYWKNGICEEYYER